MSDRFVIINADDFGFTSGINRGILEAHERGIVTSTSLMVRQPTAAEITAVAREHPRLSIGLHLDFEEWTIVDGEWSLAYRWVSPEDAHAIREETQRQIDLFHKLVGRPPTHIDSHQHVHDKEPARSIVAKMVEQQLGVPIRGQDPRIRFDGRFYGQAGKAEPYAAALSTESLLQQIESCPPGWTEIGCHPGHIGGLTSMYRQERLKELRILTDVTLVAQVRSGAVQLASYLDFARENPSPSK
jgi:chitin disaccharide deacetylase